MKDQHRRMVGAQQATLQGTPRHTQGVYSSQSRTESTDCRWVQRGATYRMERMLTIIGPVDAEADQAIITYLARTYWLRHNPQKYKSLPHRDIAYTTAQIQKRILQSVYTLMRRTSK